MDRTTDPWAALEAADKALENAQTEILRSLNQTQLLHHRPRNERERAAAALCCGEGYGNMMLILSTQWHLHVGGGAFLVGTCASLARHQLDEIAAALAKIAAAQSVKTPLP